MNVADYILKKIMERGEEKGIFPVSNALRGKRISLIPSKYTRVETPEADPVIMEGGKEN